MAPAGGAAEKDAPPTGWVEANTGPLSVSIDIAPRCSAGSRDREVDPTD